MDANTQATNEAANAEALVAGIKANFNNLVDVRDFKFHFKKVKDEQTGLESKRPTVELKLPVPSIEGVVSILEGGDEKQQSLLLEALAEIVTSRARELVNEKEDISQENFPMEELSWEKIANLPKAERRGGGISKETWEGFVEDYVAVMPGLTGKDKEKVTNAAKIMAGRFAAVKTAKPIIKMLKEQLGLYATNSPAADTYSEVIEFLTNKADNLLNMDEATLLSNL